MADEATNEAPALRDADKGWGEETFTLAYPFKFAGSEYRAFTIRVPSGSDVYAYLQTPGTDYRWLALRLTDADEKLLDAMHASDFARLLGRMGKFVAAAP